MPPKRDVRRELMSAAIGLSLATGFDETTVDEIAKAAGVARRTFFRYFRSKEDAILPDHTACLRRVAEYLEDASPLRSPLQVIADAVRIVLDMYAEDPETAVRRYELTRRVPALRQWEIAATSGYQRAFSEYLDARRPEEDREAYRLRHEMAAAAFVAAHNHVLRSWLRAGGDGDARARLATAMAEVTQALRTWMDGDAAGDDAPCDEVLVVVTSRRTPLWRVAEEIEAAARRPRS
ncbi:TetR family transcriptional regulator [Sphaerisporangium krabiense]|uniref:AcrR family transcriptional regulator n=1 Tax=Sphaerisporangium krabiense TaxID=763782 RepID=A0A7W8Z8Y7_9ACTN|nr:TetR family transcriptional regulator [Sphaerisporangium krabiense]MBB5629550.1 AcrR family transcriptional regulator [Sphaerisporangium krabiense]GII65596.1 TetR family transcriptional regulator [Sphaerisporangium krabiense]